MLQALDGLSKTAPQSGKWCVDGLASITRTHRAAVVTPSRERRTERVSAKEVFYREGEPSSTVYVIRDGVVKLFRYLPNGRARIVRLQGKSAWFGLAGLFGLLREHTAVAVNDVQVECIATSQLQTLKHKAPQRYHEMMGQCYAHLRLADLWILAFTTGPIKARLARLIILLSTIEHGKRSRSVELLTCEDMADVLGVTPESVSRFLSEFKRNGVLRERSHVAPRSYSYDFVQLERIIRAGDSRLMS